MLVVWSWGCIATVVSASGRVGLQISRLGQLHSAAGAETDCTREMPQCDRRQGWAFVKDPRCGSALYLFLTERGDILSLNRKVAGTTFILWRFGMWQPSLTCVLSEHETAVPLERINEMQSCRAKGLPLSAGSNRRSSVSFPTGIGDTTICLSGVRPQGEASGGAWCPPPAPDAGG